MSSACAAATQASKGRPTLVRLLLENGAAVDAKDCTGATPVHRCGAACQLAGVLCARVAG